MAVVRMHGKYHQGTLEGNTFTTEQGEVFHLEQVVADGVRAGFDERAMVLAPMCEYGPTYNRLVNENLGTAFMFLNRGQKDAAEMFLRKAECNAGLRHYSTITTGAAQTTLV